MFEKLEAFGLLASKDNKLFNSLAIFDFESICVLTEELKETKISNWIGKQVPISVSILSNLIEEPIFLGQQGSTELDYWFWKANSSCWLKKLGWRWEQKFKILKWLSMNERKRFLNSKRRRKNYSSYKLEYEDECIEDSEEADMSTQFLLIQKNQLIDLKQHLERYAKTLAVLGFHSGRCDLNLIKSYLIP